MGPPFTRGGPAVPVDLIRSTGSINTSMSASDISALAAAIAAAGITNNTNLDAFGRLRVSDAFTLFDSKQVWDDPDLANNVENFPLFWDNQEVSGSGTTTTFDVDGAKTTLAVSASTAGRRTRQTKQYFNYQPAKSQRTEETFAKMGVTSAGIIKRIGYFDDDNGIFLENNGGTLRFVIRSNVTGSPIDAAVEQANWNLDKMDGTGDSGLTLDIDQTQIFHIDFEWLGVGSVLFGFVINRVLYPCHLANHANLQDTVYMSTPNLPLRAEIINDGSGDADEMDVICATVISEGGSNPRGIYRTSDIGTLATDEIQANTVGSIYAVCGIRLKTAYLSATVEEVDISMIETASGTDPFLWILALNPTLTIGLDYTAKPQAQSAVEFGVGDANPADVVTNIGYPLRCGYVSGSLEGITVVLQAALRLGALIDGTRDELVLCVAPITANQDILGALSWRESW